MVETAHVNRTGDRIISYLCTRGAMSHKKCKGRNCQCTCHGGKGY